MTSPAARRRGLLLAPVLLALVLLAAGLLLAHPASAATATVTLSSSGPSPSAVTINKGDAVRFVNQDNGSHTISSNAGAWSFRKTIPAGGSATTPAFTSGGTFGYSDVYFIAVIQQNANGTITVKAPKPTASPKPTATRSPIASPKPSATRSPTPRPSASSSATPSLPPSGVAVGPGIGVLPSYAPTSGPAPNVAPSESATPATIAYGPKSEIAQTSAHRYGLPVLLALMAAVGVLSLLVRLLLAEPAAPTGDAASRRTDG